MFVGPEYVSKGTLTIDEISQEFKHQGQLFGSITPPKNLIPDELVIKLKIFDHHGDTGEELWIYPYDLEGNIRYSWIDKKISEKLHHLKEANNIKTLELGNLKKELYSKKIDEVRRKEVLEEMDYYRDIKNKTFIPQKEEEK